MLYAGEQKGEHNDRFRQADSNRGRVTGPYTDALQTGIDANTDIGAASGGRGWTAVGTFGTRAGAGAGQTNANTLLAQNGGTGLGSAATARAVTAKVAASIPFVPTPIGGGLSVTADGTLIAPTNPVQEYPLVNEPIVGFKYLKLSDFSIVSPHGYGDATVRY